MIKVTEVQYNGLIDRVYMAGHNLIINSANGRTDVYINGTNILIARKHEEMNGINECFEIAGNVAFDTESSKAIH